VRLGLKTHSYKQLPQTSILPMLHVALDNLNQRIELLQQRMQLHKEVFEVILDTSKNVEIVQFYLTNN
jgi:predicted patatin/cPLA2 family phospholipase